MNDIKELEKNIEKCLEKIEQFSIENNALRTRMEELTHEKAQLMQKNDQAKTRLESMISRLRNLEQVV
ncbi:TIGR02449 family protein [Marinicella gelatinilytica]|uniref:TIGR02449 family protein n=1 Tax=Marinicella gelatinilytica TaxID=2996017 RepID=UPI002260C21F|nr:TIGR02449 family protein [Marinicella gelatinilytica]MCX7545976.1 TIGR02449 family protein [Marinicella gelatinilytica]